MWWEGLLFAALDLLHRQKHTGKIAHATNRRNRLAGALLGLELGDFLLDFFGVGGVG
jgi:hypothetical protein